MSTKRARQGQRCMVYTANGTHVVYGRFIGTRREGEGYLRRVYKRIQLDDGTMFETILPAYADTAQ